VGHSVELLVQTCAGAQNAAFLRARQTDRENVTHVHLMHTQTCSQGKGRKQTEVFQGRVCTYKRGSDMKLEKVT
jgi:outer membrane lipoprotein-sorting protein